MPSPMPCLNRSKPLTKPQRPRASGRAAHQEQGSIGDATCVEGVVYRFSPCLRQRLCLCPAFHAQCHHRESPFSGLSIQTPRDFPGLVLVKRSQPGSASRLAAAETKPPIPPRFIIFIEGDGAAWIRSGTKPPTDPTPKRLIPLELAILESRLLDQHPGPEGSNTFIAYVSRPCQFRWAEECNEALWTSARFGSRVQELMNVALWNLVRATLIREGVTNEGQPRLSLVGHSGGGTIAALLAASRGDVDCLVTFAAPLDTDAWVENQGLSPLTGSQNPVALLDRLWSLRSHHFVGENDSVVRLEALGEFAIPTNSRKVHLVPETSHTLGWTDSWKLLRQLTCLRQTHE